MNAKVVVIAVAVGAVCLLGIVANMAKGPDPAAALEKVPTSFPADSLSGVIEWDEQVPLASLAEPGRITVVDIYTTTCPACRKLDGYLNGLAARRPDVCIKKILSNDHWRREANVRYVPTCILFDADGKIVARDNGEDRSGSETLIDWINTERQRQWQAAQSNR
jgi:thiol-disulfide isomerase/thioredoxin